MPGANGTRGIGSFLRDCGPYGAGTPTVMCFDCGSGTGSNNIPSATVIGVTDFGVAFFLGHSAFTAFEQRSMPARAGPYFAFQPGP